MLDGVLGNTTELPIAEHTVDARGQTLIVTALFDLVGLRLSPRIADLAVKPLWRTRPAGHYLDRWPNAGPLLANPARVEVIGQHWDDLCRIGGSLKLGNVSASLLTGKLQAGARQHPLAKALLEHGKLLRTVHAIHWFADECSGAGSAASSTAASPSTTYAATCGSPNVATSTTVTTTTRPCRRTATPLSLIHI